MIRKLLVYGSRNFTDYDLMNEVLSDIIEGQVRLISGMARGADSLAIKWAKSHPRNVIEIIEKPANWELNGKQAGYIRNYEMIKMLNVNHDFAVGFICGESKGSRHTLKVLQEKNIYNHLIEV